MALYYRNGHYHLECKGIAGPCRTMLDSGMSQEQAQWLNTMVENLSASVRNNLPLPEQTSLWLSGLRGRLRTRLARAGLCNAGEMRTLSELLAWMLPRKTHLSDATRYAYKTAARDLLTAWKPQRILRTLTANDAREFESGMSRDGYAVNTIRAQMRVCLSIFRAAEQQGWMDDNIFAGIKTACQVNHDRLFWVSEDLAARMLAACPTPQWRAIVALARYGGLRCPSEVMALQWTDVDFAGNRITVPQPKMASRGHKQRVIPIFPELRPHLEALYAAREPGKLWVIQHWSRHKVNWRMQLDRILQRAGIARWPKPFQNMRSTRETELADRFPEHVVCGWIGNSRPVARKHYLQITGEHFEAATGQSYQAGTRGAGNVPPGSSAALSSAAPAAAPAL
jgi:integrase